MGVTRRAVIELLENCVVLQGGARDGVDDAAPATERVTDIDELEAEAAFLPDPDRHPHVVAEAAYNITEVCRIVGCCVATSP